MLGLVQGCPQIWPNCIRISLSRGFPCGSAGKESACNVGDLHLIPGLGRFPREGKGYPLQYSGLENFMDYSPWGRKELDTTEQLSIHFTSLHFLGRMGGSILSGWESSLTSFEAILVT